jgi:cyclopropane-fatty-acyl-phospholipid synthase
MYAIDLDELTQMDREFPLFGYNRLRPTSIYDKDYLQDGTMPIKQKLKDLFCSKGISETIESSVMITSARYFNYVFNPVNFHYCFCKDKNLLGVVVEVNNTYGERHFYVLHEQKPPLQGFQARYRTQKKFHVSPFNKIEGTYDFLFSELSEKLDIQIGLIHSQQKLMAVCLKAKALPMTPMNHFKTLINHPVMPHLSIPRIYLEAAKLFFFKKLTFYQKPVPSSQMTVPRRNPGVFERLCQKVFIFFFNKIESGSLTVQFPKKRRISFGPPGEEESEMMEVKDYRFFHRVVLDGEIGFGESYVFREWETPDLVSLFKLFARNRNQLSDGNWATSILSRAKERIAHGKLRNTTNKTRVNIADHYDLGNDFFQLFLDRNMIYSCAIFKNKDDSLESAQINKLNFIIQMAKICEDDHILEIGCGWGGFAIFAAKKTGCHVTGITLSRAQYEYARERIQEEGLTDKITILLQDYRSITGLYDKIISIEMIEAVGRQFLGRFFQHCCKALKPDGTMVLQSITIPDYRYETYCKKRDWIQKHIFPGGHLPCLSTLKQAISDNTDFSIQQIDHIGKHYAKTLNEWRRRFLQKEQDLYRMGYDQQFQRKWVYYFSICEAGFASKVLHDIIMVLTHPNL